LQRSNPIPYGGGPTTGGFVSRSLSPSGGIRTDDVQARLNAGEFVIPKDVAAWKGLEFFYKLIAQSRKFRAAMMRGDRAGGYQEGGDVGDGLGITDIPDPYSSAYPDPSITGVPDQTYAGTSADVAQQYMDTSPSEDPVALYSVPASARLPMPTEIEEGQFDPTARGAVLMQPGDTYPTTYYQPPIPPRQDFRESFSPDLMDAWNYDRLYGRGRSGEAPGIYRRGGIVTLPVTTRRRAA
jgi:hypothetical protein